VVVGDRPKSDRTRRAAHVAALQVLADHGLLPPEEANYVADVFAALDAGAVEGLARPAPIKGPRKGGAWRDRLAVALAVETNHAIGLHGVSREHALTTASGVKRPTAVGNAPLAAAIPLPRSEAARRNGVVPGWPWKQAHRLLVRGEQRLGDLGIRHARAQGVAARNGDAVDEAYAADRGERLKLLASPEAMTWLLGRADLRSGRRPKATRARAPGP
jgi:hypothetical protein